MFISITVSIRFSEVNESCLAAANSALQLLIAFSSLKFYLQFLQSTKKKKKKIQAKKETMNRNKNEPSRKKTLLERGFLKKERK